MNENQNRVTIVLLCLYFFLCFNCLIFSQVTISGNAKIFVDDNFNIHIDNKERASIKTKRSSGNTIATKSIYQKHRQKNIRSAKIKLEYSKPIDLESQLVKINPVWFRSVIVMNFWHNQDIVSLKSYSHVLGAIIEKQIYLFYKIRSGGRKISNAFCYINRALQFTSYIRPPPEFKELNNVL